MLKTPTGPVLGGPSRLRVPDGMIALFPHHPDYTRAATAFTTLRGQRTRPWLDKHAYHCLPLVLGNQTGVLVSTLFGFTATWNGGQAPRDVTVTPTTAGDPALQSVEGHFGMGTFTVQFRVTLRTPPGVNLLVVPPPNYPKHGVWPLTALVETAELRRDFTYTIKLTAPGSVTYAAGEALAALIPVAAGFPDSFQLVGGDATAPADVIAEELEAQNFSTFHRSTIEPTMPGGIGRLYMKGVDSYGHPFKQHQTRAGRCPKRKS